MSESRTDSLFSATRTKQGGCKEAGKLQLLEELQQARKREATWHGFYSACHADLADPAKQPKQPRLRTGPVESKECRAVLCPSPSVPQLKPPVSISITLGPASKPESPKTRKLPARRADWSSKPKPPVKVFRSGEQKLSDSVRVKESAYNEDQFPTVFGNSTSRSNLAPQRQPGKSEASPGGRSHPRELQQLRQIERALQPGRQFSADGETAERADARTEDLFELNQFGLHMFMTPLRTGPKETRPGVVNANALISEMVEPMVCEIDRSLNKNIKQSLGVLARKALQVEQKFGQFFSRPILQRKQSADDVLLDAAKSNKSIFVPDAPQLGGPEEQEACDAKTRSNAPEEGRRGTRAADSSEGEEVLSNPEEVVFAKKPKPVHDRIFDRLYSVHR